MSEISWLYSPDGTKGKAWNPVTGCDPVSPGCLNCYAAALASRGMCEDHRTLTSKKKRRNAAGRLVNRAVFNGTVNVHHDRLDDPLRWRKGVRVFVNSMSDLFHERVSFEFIAAVYKTMAATPRHTYLVLTKRPSQAVAWYEWAAKREGYFAELGAPWPLPNVQLGISAENQRTLDARTHLLLQCPAAIRWISAEPLLGPIDLRPYLPHPFDREPHCPWCEDCVGRGPRDHWTAQTDPDAHGPFIDWVVAGGESGPGSRRCDVEWLQPIVEQCDSYGVPVFVKQLGSLPHRESLQLALADSKGEDPDEWVGPLEPLRRRELARTRATIVGGEAR